MGIFDNKTQNRTLAPGEIDVAASVPGFFQKGQVYYVNVNVSVASTKKWPLGPVVFSASADDATAGSDQTLTGNYRPENDTYGFAPIAITGIPLSNPLAVLVKGDSIVVGGTGRSQAYGNYGKGAIPRALTALGVAWGTEAINGAALNAFQSPSLIDPNTSSNTKPNNRVLDAIAQYYTHFIQALGMNDINLAVPLSAIKFHMANWHRWAKGKGLVVGQTTISVWSSFSAQLKADLVSLNTDIRSKTGMPNIDSIIEYADLWETARNSGTIKPGLTTDGVHPNDTGVTTLATTLGPELQKFLSRRNLI
jgi:lysophospholipase L1-like esterase